MKSLLLSLGHNSSAIFVDVENSILIGYEQERLDGIKSSSRYPHDAISEIIKNVGMTAIKGCEVFVSHWFDSNVIPYNTKYMTQLDYDNLKSFASSVSFTNDYFTHHDAHAHSAYGFYKHHFQLNHYKYAGDKFTHVIVADGFGTNQEVLSIYCDQPDGEIYLKKRIYGYQYSLGLMYQYATSFCGMKENQDEYKFLGYEPLIETAFPADEHDEYIHGLNHLVRENVYNLLKGLLTETSQACTEKPKKYPIDIDSLRDVKQKWFSTFTDVINSCNIQLRESTGEKSRIVIAYFIQQSIEMYFKQLVAEYKIHNAVLAGGLFYNVKLNNVILKAVPGLFSVMPLAGDQGAAIGMYQRLYNNYNFESLSIGKRNLNEFDKIKDRNVKVIDIEDGDTYDYAVRFVSGFIMAGKIVNIVIGNMEFGPRALCNTSSLFMPTTKLVALNNRLNRRNEVMPCAPVIKEENAKLFFDIDELERVVGSDKYMICTHDYIVDTESISEFYRNYGGVAHKKTMVDDVYTGRPQLVKRGSFIWDVLNYIESCDFNNAKCIVNTSFNAHGRPIVFDVMDIIHNFRFQCDQALEINKDGFSAPHLVILKQ